MTNPSQQAVDNRRGHARFLRWRWRVAAVVAVLLVGIVAVHYCRQRMAELPELRSVGMERRDLKITVNTSGIVEPVEVIEVGATVPGRIIEIGDNSIQPPREVGIGTRVAKGDILARLDGELYQVDIDKAVAAWKLAQAEVARLEIQLQQATVDLDRAKALRQTNSPAAYEKVATAHAMAKAELAIGSARRDQALAAKKLAELKMKNTIIRSPVDGVVIDQRTMKGQNVSPGAHALFLLAKSVDAMQIRASVSEADIGKVQVGQSVTFSVDAYREVEMIGHVDEILMNARIKGSFVTYDVIVKIDQPLVKLMPHMTADVEFITQRRDQAWLVPSEALRWKPSLEQVVDNNNLPIGSDRIAVMQDSTESEHPQEADKLREGDPALVWVKGNDGKVKPIQVTVGVDDGVNTEVIGQGFREDLPVVVGTVKKTTLARIIPSVKTVR